jgi:hypothetical protein
MAHTKSQMALPICDFGYYQVDETICDATQICSVIFRCLPYSRHGFYLETIAGGLAIWFSVTVLLLMYACFRSFGIHEGHIIIFTIGCVATVITRLTMFDMKM